MAVSEGAAGMTGLGVEEESPPAPPGYFLRRGSSQELEPLQRGRLLRGLEEG